jgi:predicted ABC-type ATPase
LLKKWKTSGYRIEIVYLKLPSPDLAVSRISTRVKQGGHAVPKADVVRRFSRSWRNFIGTYRALADSWTVYDNSGTKPIVGIAVMKKPVKRSYDLTEAAGRALRRSARVARKIARMHGTPIYVWRDGKVVALKP